MILLSIATALLAIAVIIHSVMLNQIRQSIAALEKGSCSDYKEFLEGKGDVQKIQLDMIGIKSNMAYIEAIQNSQAKKNEPDSWNKSLVDMADSMISKKILEDKIKRDGK